MVGFMAVSAALTDLNKVKAGELKSRLRSVEEDLSKNLANRHQLRRAAELTATELEQIQTKGIHLAKSLTVLSARADGLEARLKQLREEEAEKSAAMAKRKSQFVATTGALQRMARAPISTLVALPQSHNNTIRSALLLRAVIPKLQREATDLAEELKILAALQAEIAEEKKSLAQTLIRLDRKKRALSALSAKKITLLEKTQTAKQRAAKRAALLSTRAGNIRDLLQELSKQRSKSVLLKGNLRRQRSDSTANVPDDRRLEIAPSTWWRGSSPDPGNIIVSFGDKMPNGTFSKGIYIKTRSSVPVVAPVKGRVVFAGVFRGYGNLIIIELPNKDHALLAGMARVTTGIGDEVLAGEPLGEMAPSFDKPPKLYFELRRQGRPINPLPPSAEHRNKVRG
tara:strand:+ start:5188 stop:6381 length:1194 start_codon:yes stop_codon:yes gene_type:complete